MQWGAACFELKIARQVFAFFVFNSEVIPVVFDSSAPAGVLSI